MAVTLCGAVGLLVSVAITTPPAASAVEAHILAKTFGSASSTLPDPYPLAEPDQIAVDESDGDVYVANPAVNDRQTMAIDATGGTFTFTFTNPLTHETVTTKPIRAGTFNGAETTPVLFKNAWKEVVEPSDVKVVEVEPHSSFDREEKFGVEFEGMLAGADVPTVSCDGAGLTGPEASCSFKTEIVPITGADVEKFNSAGELIWVLGNKVDKTTGGDLCTVASHDECQPATPGSAPGQFEEPRVLALDNSGDASKGDIYVGDTGDGLVSKFTAEGKLAESWGDNGPNGAPDGQFDIETADRALNREVSSLAVSATSGELYLGQAGDEEIVVVEPDGQALRKLITSQRAAYHSSSALAVNSAGDLYLVEPDGQPENGAFEIGPGDEALGEVDPGPATGLALDPASEDIYVAKGREVARYNALHEPLEPFIGYDEGLAATAGVAVDQGQALYVAEPAHAEIALYTPQSVQAPFATIEAPSGVGYTKAGVSGRVDPEGHVTVCSFEYVSEAHFQAERFGERQFKSYPEEQQAISEGYERVGHAACEPELVGSGATAVAVHAALGKLKPGTVYHVRLAARNAAGTAHSTEPDPTFATEAAAKPTVTIESASSVTATDAKLVGHVDPNAPEPLTPEIEEAFAVRWHFRCKPECGFHEGTIAADDVTHEVSGAAEGLLPGTRYEVSLLAQNSGPAATAGPVFFTTLAIAPSVDSTSPADVTSTAATLSTTLDPGGAATTAHFQYLTVAQYRADGEAFGAGTQSTAESGPIGSDDSVHEASVGVAGLLPDTAYEFRVLASNEVQRELAGPATLLYTYPVEAAGGCENEQLRLEDGSTGLPDCRAYELVSSPEAVGEAYVPEAGGGGGAQRTVEKSQLARRAATDGGGVVYVAEPPAQGGNGNVGNGLGDQYLATRGAAGWSSGVITPANTYPANDAGYVAFSGDLSQSILYDAGADPLGEVPPLAAGAPDCQMLYARTGTASEAGFQPLFTETGEHLTSPIDDCGEPLYAGANSGSEAVPAASDRLFQTEAALSSGVKPPVVNSFKEFACLRGCDLYDSTPKGVQLIDLLPNGEQAPGATFGGPGPAGTGRSDFSHVISADGSRVFWTDTANGEIYVRENIGRAKVATVQVSAGAAQYWTASSDGRYVYYTENGAVLRFDVQGEAGKQREEVVPAAGGAQAVIGINEEGEDGAYVYVVAAGKLAPQAEARSCQIGNLKEERQQEEGSLPAGLGCNLYLVHGGQTTFIAALSALDDQFDSLGARAQGSKAGDWMPDLGARSAELTPDGHSIVFQSIVHLTGVGGTTSTNSIFDYDADGGRLACVSCEPSGAQPKSEASGLLSRVTALPFSDESTYVGRWISADGSRVFFETEQALVPQDTNGLENVYEWEREGTPGCPQAAVARPNDGCTHLLSDGEGASDSLLLEASPSGDDVFILTRDELLPSAAHDQMRVFDVRVNGGFPAATGSLAAPPACESAEACLPPLSEPPFASFAASSAFSGPGNVLTPSQPAKEVGGVGAESHAPKQRSSATPKLARALARCRGLRGKSRRSACERRARKRYGGARGSAATRNGRGR
jgi:hypothetical protein